MKSISKSIATIAIWSGFGAMIYFITNTKSTELGSLTVCFIGLCAAGATVAIWMFGSSD